MISDEIMIEIDTTLDQLIRNAETIQRVDFSELSETEIEAFQKTQESLLHHFMDLDHRLESKRKTQSASYRIKLNRFEKLKSVYHRNIEGRRKNSFLSKRRSKRLLISS